MTPGEHYRAAMWFLDEIHRWESNGSSSGPPAHADAGLSATLAAAQIHATLASVPPSVSESVAGAGAPVHLELLLLHRMKEMGGRVSGEDVSNLATYLGEHPVRTRMTLRLLTGNEFLVESVDGWQIAEGGLEALRQGAEALRQD